MEHPWCSPEIHDEPILLRQRARQQFDDVMQRLDSDGIMMDYTIYAQLHHCLCEYSLQVGDIAQTEAFYCDILGFEVMTRMPTALFVSAGHYHHHIGLNIWHSRGAAPADANTAKLRFFTIDLPSEEARAAVVARLDAAGITHTETAGVVVVRDPWQNTLLLQVGSAPDARTAANVATAIAQR